MKKEEITETTPYSLYYERWKAIYDRLNSGACFRDEKSQTQMESYGPCEDTSCQKQCITDKPKA